MSALPADPVARALAMRVLEQAIPHLRRVAHLALDEVEREAMTITLEAMVHGDGVEHVQGRAKERIGQARAMVEALTPLAVVAILDASENAS